MWGQDSDTDDDGILFDLSKISQQSQRKTPRLTALTAQNTQKSYTAPNKIPSSTGSMSETIKKVVAAGETTRNADAASAVPGSAGLEAVATSAKKLTGNLADCIDTQAGTAVIDISSSSEWEDEVHGNAIINLSSSSFCDDITEQVGPHSAEKADQPPIDISDTGSSTTFSKEEQQIERADEHAQAKEDLVLVTCTKRNSPHVWKFRIGRGDTLEEIIRSICPETNDFSQLIILRGNLEVFHDYAPEDLIDDNENELKLEIRTLGNDLFSQGTAMDSEPKFNIRINVKSGKPIVMPVSASTSIADIIDQIRLEKNLGSSLIELEFDHEPLEASLRIGDTEIEEDDLLDAKF